MTLASLAIAGFWIGVTLLFYTFAGYPLLAEFVARLKPKPIRAQRDNFVPSVCAVLVAYNEAGRIKARIENLFASQYPAGQLSVLLVSDGSTDHTVELVEGLNHPHLTVLARPGREGKAAGLNAGVAQCQCELIVFADARQRFAEDTIAKLSANFADPEIGAVSGALEIESAGTNIGGGVDTYWKMEKRLRECESLFDSCIGCTGAVYAIRRSLFRPIPNDTILDDVVIPMTIANQGFRVVHHPGAFAYDPQSLEPEAEKRRKRRTLAGNFQMLFRYPGWLLPAGSRLWWQLTSHKYLRLLAPFVLIEVFVANAFLAEFCWYRFAFAGQVVFYLLALTGYLFPRLRHRIFSLPSGFVFLNFSVVQALLHYLRSEDAHRWNQQSRPSSP